MARFTTLARAIEEMSAPQAVLSDAAASAAWTAEGAYAHL